MKTFEQYLIETSVKPLSNDSEIDRQINALIAELKAKIKDAIPEVKPEQGFFQKLGNWWKDMNDPNYDTPYSMARQLKNYNAKSPAVTGQKADLGENVLPSKLYFFFKEESKKFAQILNENINQQAGEFTPNPQLQQALRTGQKIPPSPKDLPGKRYLGGNWYATDQGEMHQINPVEVLRYYLDGPFKKKLKQLVLSQLPQGKMYKAKSYTGPSQSKDTVIPLEQPELQSQQATVSTPENPPSQVYPKQSDDDVGITDEELKNKIENTPDAKERAKLIYGQNAPEDKADTINLIYQHFKNGLSISQIRDKIREVFSKI